jgi:hypothetical protein
MLVILFKLNKYTNLTKIPSKFAALEKLVKSRENTHIEEFKSKLYPLILIMGFAAMFLIPFIGHKFIEQSVYAPVYISYVRYIGPLIIPAIGGLVFMVFERNKSFNEWFLIISMMFLTALIYEQTYMKWFLPLFMVLFICVGLTNILQSKQKKHVMIIVSIFLLISSGFSGYYQFLHFTTTHGINERYIEDSTYAAGRWMKEYATGSAISNDRLFGIRMAATSETTHYLVSSTLLNCIYGFVTGNLSQFEWHPITSEEFWFDIGQGKHDVGERIWDNINMLNINPHDSNIIYFTENVRARGNIIWAHGIHPSKLLHLAYREKDCVYDCGNVRVWKLSKG